MWACSYSELMHRQRLFGLAEGLWNETETCAYAVWTPKIPIPETELKLGYVILLTVARKVINPTLRLCDQTGLDSQYILCIFCVFCVFHFILLTHIFYNCPPLCSPA
jgi:hypothetical protein